MYLHGLDESDFGLALRGLLGDDAALSASTVGRLNSKWQAALRLRTVAANRFKRVENTTAVIWKLLLIAERRFRRLNAPELLAEVWKGAQFINGIAVDHHQEDAAA